MKMRRKKTQSLVENTPSAYDQEEEGRYDSSAVSSSGWKTFIYLTHHIKSRAKECWAYDQ